MSGGLRDFLRDRRGISSVEFALIGPVMFLLLMGTAELLYQGYMQANLIGLAQAAGRSGTIQGADSSAIDGRILTDMRALNPNMAFATGYPKRLSYRNFGSIAPEPFVDTNGDGIRSAGECFTDLNGNKNWDANPGIDGRGGASDVVAYEIQMTYPRLLPVAQWLGWGNSTVISASTLFKSQPYATQPKTTDETVCT